MVVGVVVDVEQAPVEGSGYAFDRGLVPALGDVRDREQRHLPRGD
jgi:hypothetical protein